MFWPSSGKVSETQAFRYEIIRPHWNLVLWQCCRDACQFSSNRAALWTNFVGASRIFYAKTSLRCRNVHWGCRKQQNLHCLKIIPKSKSINHDIHSLPPATITYIQNISGPIRYYDYTKTKSWSYKDNGAGGVRCFDDPRHWPLWGEFTGDRWIPSTKGQ